MSAISPEFKICNVCLMAKSLSAFRVANGYRGRSDTCRECEQEERLFTCTKCGETKPARDFATDTRRTSGLHSWCRDCKNKQTKEREERERAEYKGQVPDARRTALGKPKLKPTALYKATPKKRRAEWTEKERKRYLRVLLDPERRAKAKALRMRNG